MSRIVLVSGEPPDNEIRIPLPKNASTSKPSLLKLKRALPATLGQAARVSGVTPAAISLLLVHLKRRDAA